MRTTVDCVPCYIKQVISTLRTAGVKKKNNTQSCNALFPTSLPNWILKNTC